MAKQIKKRNKKNCRLKRLGVTSLYATSDLLMVFTGGMKETHAFDKKTLTTVDIGPSIAQAIQTVAFKWSVLMAVFCRRQDGQQYMQSILVPFTEPRRRANIENFLHDQHMALLKECNPAHVLNIGWIASTVPYEIDDNTADILFTKQGAWERLAEWEKVAI